MTNRMEFHNRLVSWRIFFNEILTINLMVIPEILFKGIKKINKFDNPGLQTTYYGCKFQENVILLPHLMFGNFISLYLLNE